MNKKNLTRQQTIDAALISTSYLAPLVNKTLRLRNDFRSSVYSMAL